MSLPLSSLSFSSRRSSSRPFSSPPASSSRPACIALGVALGATVSVVAPLLGACSCDDGRPSTRSCDDPLSDFSGVTEAHIVDANAIRGIQGGSHFQFQIGATGTGLSGCIAQSATLTAGGVVVATSNTAVTTSTTAGGILSTPIYLFPSFLSGPGHLHVETLGRTIDLDVSLDAGFGFQDAAIVPDANLDAAPPPPPDAFVEARPLTVHLVDVHHADFAGATVRVDVNATGRSLVATSDAEGNATTSAFEWPPDTKLDVTISADGLVPITLVGLEHGDESLLEPLVLSRPPEIVSVSGTLAVMDALHRVYVDDDTRVGEGWNDVGTSYTLPVERGVPFRLLAFEHTRTETGRDVTTELFGLGVLESPALDADATIDLTIGDASSLTRVTGSVLLPFFGGFEAASIAVSVEDTDDGGRLPSLVTQASYALERASYEIAFAPHESVVAPATRIVAHGADSDATVYVSGYPAMGEQPVTWLSPPSTDHDGSTLWAADTLDASFEGTLRVLLSDTEPRWQLVLLHRGAQRMPLPSLDTSAWVYPLTAHTEACVPADSLTGPRCARSTTGATFQLER